MVRAVLAILLLLAGALSACDDDPAPPQNETERAVDPGVAQETSSSGVPPAYHLVRELGDGDEKIESVDVCARATGAPEILAAVEDLVGPVIGSRTDQEACVLTGQRTGQERVMQIVVTTDPDTTLAGSFGISSRGYRYASGPCQITAASYPTADGDLAAVAECGQDVWVAVATPVGQGPPRSEQPGGAVTRQLDAVLEVAIKEL